MILEVHRHYLLKTISQNDSDRQYTLSKCLKNSRFTFDIWVLGRILKELVMHLKFTGLENLCKIIFFSHGPISVGFLCVLTLVIYSFHWVLSFDLYEHDFFMGWMTLLYLGGLSIIQMFPLWELKMIYLVENFFLRLTKSRETLVPLPNGDGLSITRCIQAMLSIHFLSYSSPLYPNSLLCNY